MRIPNVTGKIIKHIAFEEFTDSLGIEFTDGSHLHIENESHHNLEDRYIRCSDNLQSFIGATILCIAERDGPSERPTVSDYHDTKFVHIVTNGGTIVLHCHNEHNGPPTVGFKINCRLVDIKH